MSTDKTLDNKETWSGLLPIIQAYVDGKEIERRDKDIRLDGIQPPWRPLKDELHNLLSYEFRIAPGRSLRIGTWRVDFETFFKGPDGGVLKQTGTFSKRGYEALDASDSFPSGDGWKISEPRFEPDATQLEV